MFEHKDKPLLSRSQFALRLVKNAGVGLAIIVVSLLVGMVGYHVFEGQPWIDAFANASMILSGMGPLGELKTSAGKLFAGFYALYSGLAIITITAIIFAPVIHRIMHKFHVPDEDDEKDRESGKMKSRHCK